MADKKISALTSLAQGDVAASTDVLPIVDTSATETKKITASALVGAGMTAGVTNVDINSGSIDGTTIGANSAAAGTFTNLTASGTVSFSGATVSNGGAVTTIDINGGTIDATSIGASSASTGAFTTLTTSSTVTLNGGTANGVLYLNGSKVATSGSNITFDGTDLRMPNGGSMLVGASASGGAIFLINGTAAAQRLILGTSGTDAVINATRTSGTSPNLLFQIESTEGFCLTSTSLYTASGINVGIGTSSPGYKLDVNTDSNVNWIRTGCTTTNSGAGVIFKGAISGQKNWVIANQYNVNGGLEFTQTTAAGGSTIGSSPAMVLDYSGNLGIGTSSITPVGSQTVLAVGNSSGGTVAHYQSGSLAYRTSASSSGVDCFNPNATPIQWYTSGTSRMLLDSSGNLGLGVTPSAWSSGGNITLADNKAIGAAGQYLNLSANWYYSGGDKYVGNGYATLYYQQVGAHKWYTAPNNTSGAGATLAWTTAMTLDASGNLGVGTSSPESLLHLSKASSGAAGPIIFLDNSASSALGNSAGIRFTTDAGGTVSNYAGYFECVNTNAGNGAADLTFGTWNGSSRGERARITSGGFFKASNTGTYSSSTNDRYEFTSDKNDLTILVNSTNTGANVNNVYSQLPAGANAGAYHFVGSISGSGLQFTVDADGDVKNTNNSYGSISDIKLKQDVVDAASQWDDIKALRVRKYRFKRNSDAALQIGLVAQEAEAVSPGLVEETADRDEEGNDLGTTTKSVKYSVLYMKAVKALQEAMNRIEQLEAKVAALESK
jgi:hypothetical protein